MRTEKEFSIEHGQLTAKLYIEYDRNGKPDDCWMEFMANGHHVTWNRLGHEHGQSRILDFGKRTPDWETFKLLAPKELSLEVLRYIKGEKR